MKPAQSCGEPGCTEPAAFKTRTRPTLCDTHITAILRASNLEPLEPFIKPKTHRLTQCLTCGCVAYYSLEYTLQKREESSGTEATCMACFWRQWATLSPRSLEPVDEAEVRQHADESGYDYLEPLTNPSLTDDPHRVQCRRCQRIMALRPSDIGSGCQCRSNPSRAKQTPNVSGKRGQKVLLKDSELAAVQWWDHSANDPSLWATVTEKARKEVQWICIYCQYHFSARIVDMTSAFPECPNCKDQRDAEYEKYKTTQVTDVPELLTAWADDADPHTVTVAGGWELRRFQCPQGHHPQLTPDAFLARGCPTCRGQRTVDERLEAITEALSQLDLTPTINPEIASQWHPTKNGKLKLETLSPRSQRNCHWVEASCGHEWEQTPRGREANPRLRCPKCDTILDSLAYHYPELAAEWSAENPLSAWQVRPTAQTTFVPLWVCGKNPQHIWAASLTSRSIGSNCPECREHGKSKIELEHFAAAGIAFADARSGRSVRHPSFRRRNTWLVDISVELANAQMLIIEYDGHIGMPTKATSIWKSHSTC